MNGTSIRKHVLWGTEILLGNGCPPAVSQITEVIRGQIENGRWQEKEQLPDPRVLSEESGLSHSSIARAYERLTAEGYTGRIKRKGTFLISQRPPAEQTSPGDVIGIAMREPTNTGLFRSADFVQHLIEYGLDRIRSQGFAKEIAVVREAQASLAEIPSQELFDHQPGGVFCVGPVPPIVDSRGRRLPAMYVHHSAHHLRPQVIGDSMLAVQQLTRRAVEGGHRNIVALGDGAQETESHLRWLHHRDTLRSVGLEADEEAFRESLTLDYRNQGGVEDFLGKRESATCFIALKRVLTARSIAMAAARLGRSLPESLSLLSYGCETLHLDGRAVALSGVEHNTERIILLGIDTLMRQMRGMDVGISSLQIEPVRVEGDTFRALS